MKFLFTIDIVNRVKNTDQPIQLTTLAVEVDSYDITTIKDAEKAALEKIGEAEIKEYYKGKNKTDTIEADIRLSKLIID